MQMNIALLHDFIVRPVLLEDAENVVGLLAAIAYAEDSQQLEPLATLDASSEHAIVAIQAFWHSLDLAHDTQVVVTPDDVIVGYIDVKKVFADAEHTSQCVRIHHVSGVHPAYTGRGIGTWLLRYAQAWTQQHAGGEPMRIVAWLQHNNERARRLFTREGYVCKGDHAYEAVQLDVHVNKRLVSQYDLYGKVITPDALTFLCEGTKNITL
ncbi:GNAT family N-acetyltransferase [Dictyobacter kobayashii]|uniref:N-acetyltransferase domain-containing protein n=1 Tax=Dictyobacter kobayashii TaxID=2014872 RepID=A0A402ATV1_9CHLR|nr:GNAT family N-acetyltransferase [Dictyobacter kobayashii]GCE22541.1 hypothetical protein KDK_63410 [Dictyobacter kobayashii]